MWLWLCGCCTDDGDGEGDNASDDHDGMWCCRDVVVVDDVDVVDAQCWFGLAGNMGYLVGMMI